MAPLLTFYGDDFTGSSAVMEVLSFAGVPTMLFMESPSAETLALYPDLKVVGVAGIARSKNPTWMRSELPAVFDGLKALGAPLNHYKVCSTFDSAPQIGSIGVATEIGATIFDSAWVPLVVGAPVINRFQVFGELYAGAGDAIYRLDRHPVMARHPVTPMGEADLGKHLSEQTDMHTGVVTLVDMKSGNADVSLAKAVDAGAKIIALDIMDAETTEEAGRLIWQGGASFAVGSQGVEYALVSHWREIGLLERDHTQPSLAPVEQLFSVNGSCSATTAEQIAVAEENGFTILEFAAHRAVDQAQLQAERDRVELDALKLLEERRDVLVTTARGPDDPAIAQMHAAIDAAAMSNSDANDALGATLGELVASIRRKTGLPRVAIGGGDTSGHSLTAIGAEALSAVAPLAPGAPLCCVHSRKAAEMDGLEVTLKGGQMGRPDFFVSAKGG